MVEAMKNICPDFATMTIDWAMGGIMALTLDLLTREYVIIASCVTLGHAAPQLRAHIDAALKLGATKQQIVEVTTNDILCRRCCGRQRSQYCQRGLPDERLTSPWLSVRNQGAHLGWTLTPAFFWRCQRPNGALFASCK